MNIRLSNQLARLYDDLAEITAITTDDGIRNRDRYSMNGYKIIKELILLNIDNCSKLILEEMREEEETS